MDAQACQAQVIVPDYQLSLAIGKEGQNARLAARLTGWRIDIRSDAEPIAADADPASHSAQAPHSDRASHADPAPHADPVPSEDPAVASAAQDPAHTGVSPGADDLTTR